MTCVLLAAGIDVSYGWGYFAAMTGLLLGFVAIVACISLGLRALGRNAEEAAFGRIPARTYQFVLALSILLALGSVFMQYPVGRNPGGAREWLIGVPIPWHSRTVDERGSHSELPMLWPLMLANAALWLVLPHCVLRGVLRRRRRAEAPA